MREREREIRHLLYVCKFGDAVNSGQATRCRDINVVRDSLVKRSGEIYFVGTVTGCSRICRIHIQYIYTRTVYICIYMYMYTAHDGVDQPCYVISRLYPSQPGPNRFPKDTASSIVENSGVDLQIITALKAMLEKP